MAITNVTTEYQASLPVVACKSVSCEGRQGLRTRNKSRHNAGRVRMGLAGQRMADIPTRWTGPEQKARLIKKNQPKDEAAEMVEACKVVTTSGENVEEIRRRELARVREWQEKKRAEDKAAGARALWKAIFGQAREGMVGR